MSTPVAIQLYSLRNECAEDFAGTLKKVKEMGYDGVEFAGLHGKSAAEVKQMCADNGLVPISAHVPYLDMVADPKGVLGQYAEIGCKFVAIPYLNEDYRPGTDKFPEVIENAKMLDWEMRREMRDDRMLFFSKRFCDSGEKGRVARAYYAVRVVSTGDFIAPGVSVEAMYDPTVRARTAPRRIRVER